jgi:hypothetical protein
VDGVIRGRLRPHLHEVEDVRDDSKRVAQLVAHRRGELAHGRHGLLAAQFGLCRLTLDDRAPQRRGALLHQRRGTVPAPAQRLQDRGHQHRGDRAKAQHDPGQSLAQRPYLCRPLAQDQPLLVRDNILRDQARSGRRSGQDQEDHG